MSGMGCYVVIEIALRDRVPQERPVTIPRDMRQSPLGYRILHEGQILHANYESTGAKGTTARDGTGGGGVQDGDGSRRAARREASPFGMNIVSFLAAADDLAARIERDGLDAIPAADLSPGLLAVRG